jgi:lipopolysaccharide transport system ATP-binding protein
MDATITPRTDAHPAESGDFPAVESLGVGKKFAKSLRQALRYGIADIGREFLLSDGVGRGLRSGEFWALDDVSFKVRRGEALAVIGRNGSGKSTLLKLLYGLIKPDAGEILIRGRMAALIELGAGFDPLLSGRENVYINASILGLPREEVNEVLPAIIDFSGLRDFMETPVKFYSSGMRARLAYSIATNLSPDIFLVDEVLAVGDMEFRQKCLRNMVRFVEKGGSLLFVSHMAHQIQMVCSHGIVIESGKVVCAGSALEALDHYYRSDLHLPEILSRQPSSREVSPSEAHGCSIASVEVQTNRQDGRIYTGDDVSIVMTADFSAEAEALAVFQITGRDLLTVVAVEDSGELRHCKPGRHIFRFRMPSLPLMPGLFHVRASLRGGAARLPLAHFGVDNAPLRLLVSGEPNPTNVRARSVGQLVRIEGKWL